MKHFATILWMVLCVPVLAVKESLFKNCAQSGFCHRNRHIARADHVTSPYFIDPASVAVANTSVAGIVYKKVPNGAPVLLPFELSLLVGDSVRFRLDEDRSSRHAGVSGKLNPRRYSAAEDAFGTPEVEKTVPLAAENVHILLEAVELRFGPTVARLELAPVRLTLEYEGQTHVEVNGRNLLNVEHWRAAEDNDTQLWPFESDFDLFSDSFTDSRDDTKPWGPESVAADVRFVDYTNVYGLAGHSDSLRLQDTVHTEWPYRLFNVDIFEYDVDSRMPMYGSIPFVVAVRSDAAVGVFWVNAADTFVDVDTKYTEAPTHDAGDNTNGYTDTHWMSESGVLDIILMAAKTPEQINHKYSLLTGAATLPPQFALGYHQCRWNYNDERDVLDIHTQMDRHHVPYDTIWLDIEYADRKQYFTWNLNAFPDPMGMAKKLDHTGRNLVVIVDPHLKTDYSVSDAVMELGIGIRATDNSTYHGHCWPGELVWIDPMHPGAQPYWDTLFALSAANPLMGNATNIHLWNDMNEPSFFNAPETTAPRDVVHYGDFENRAVHNMWGKSFHELTYHALERRQRPTSRQRPFVLTRSYFAGSQRTAAMWTGDNRAQWDHLKASVPMILSANVVGMPFAGADVGGFFGNPTKELLVRWYQTGLWYPFFRAHAHIDSMRREPWVAGEPYSSHIRDAVRLRYTLMPTFYTLFRASSVSGRPVWTPMAWAHPGTPAMYPKDDQFYVGGLLVAPVTHEAALGLSVFLPGGERFYNFSNGVIADAPPVELAEAGAVQFSVTLGDIPVFLRGGSVTAKRDRYRRSTRLMRDDPFHLVVALDGAGRAAGELYVDDGESFAYTEGVYLLSTIVVDGGRIISSSSGTGNSLVVVEKISVLGGTAPVSVTATQDGRLWPVLFTLHDHYVVVENLGVAVGRGWAVEFGYTVHDEL